MSMITTLGALAALAAAAPAEAPPVEAFAQMPRFENVSLSPSGQRFFSLYRDEGMDEYRFVVFDRSNGLDTLYATAQTDEFRIREPVWTSEDTIVFGVKFNASRYGTDTVETRLMSLNVETGEIDRLFRDRRGSEGMPVQIETDVDDLALALALALAIPRAWYFANIAS